MGSSSSSRKLRGVLGLAAALLVGSSSIFAAPTSRSAARMVFNQERQRILLFGGVSPVDASSLRRSFGDTWEWTGRQWIQLFPANSPSRRSGHVMVYDSNRKQVFLFGGGDGANNFNDSWVYKGRNWTRLDTPNAPPARHLAAAAFDPALDKVILYGGADATTTFYDTWLFDGTTWSRVQENSPQLTSPSMVFDEARGAVLLLGLNATSKVEMYRWLGTSWEKLAPATLPDCIKDGAIVYEKHNQRVLFNGGSCVSASTSDLTFEWDGSNWTKVAATTTAGRVFGQAIAYDEARQEVIQFGGGDFDERSLTYAFRDGNWYLRGQNFTPGPRSLFVFEQLQGANYLYGGQNDFTQLNDFWRLKDGRWQQLVAADQPASCPYPLGAVDTSRSRLVVICQDSVTYEFDGSKWYKAADQKDKPVSRRFSSIAYDEQNKKVVLYGGFDTAAAYIRDTWTWDGTKWTRMDRKGAPPARMLGTMFYDPAQKKVMLFGGIGRPTSNDRITRYGDMWSFNGSSWTAVTPSTKPGPRYGAAARFDSQSNKVVMFGGKNELENYLDEQWSWDGTTWTKDAPATRPDVRMNGAMSVDPSTQSPLYFGGYAAGYYGDLWRLTPAGWIPVVPISGRSRSVSRDQTIHPNQWPSAAQTE